MVLGAALSAVAGCSSDDLSFGELTGGAGGQGQGAGQAGGAGGSGTAGDPGTGGATGGGGAATGGVGQGGAGEGGEGDGGGGNQAKCDQLLEDLQKELAEAQACSLLLPIVQCSTFVDGVCCPVPVADGQSSETQKYLEELDDYFAEGCVPVCPPVECNPIPVGTCQPGNQGNLDGTCVES